MTVLKSNASPAAAEDRVDARTRLLVAVLATAAFMAVLDGTIVGVALADLADEFGSPIGTIAWVTAAYLLAAGLAMPLSGWSVDRFGGRRTFLVGLGLFVAGSLLSALAGSVVTLVAFRVLQGLGGGVLEPTSLTLAARAAGSRRMGRVMGFLSLIINVAPVAGPLIGGLLAGSGHWPWIFLINLPIGVAVLGGALLLVRPDRPTGPVQRPDVRGMLLLSPGFVALLFAVDRLGLRSDGWSVAVPAVAGIVLLAGYVVHALRSTGPAVLDLQLLRYRRFAGGLAVMALVGLTMYSQLVALPLYAGEVRGLTGAAQGLIVCGLGLGLLMSMGTAGRISDRTGPRPLVRGGAVVTGIGFAVFAAIGHAWPVWAVTVLFLGVGLGFGAVAAPTFASVYRAVPPESIAQATTAMFISVQLAASVGVAVVGLLIDRLDVAAFPVLFWILTGGTVAMAALSSLLPGRPDPD